MSDHRVILMAEDEPLSSMALRAQLEALGHTVPAAASDGRQAVTLGRCHPVDLALLDLRMPGMNGIEAASELFRHHPIPVALLTGFGTADLPTLDTPPIFAVITKPVGLAELGRGIRDAAAAFQDWVVREGREEEVRESLRTRELIARALPLLSEDEDQPFRNAADRFLQRAREQDREPEELARELLARA